MTLEQAKDIFTEVGDQAALATCVLHIGAAFAGVHEHTQAIKVVSLVLCTRCWYSKIP